MPLGAFDFRIHTDGYAIEWGKRLGNMRMAAYHEKTGAERRTGARVSWRF